jgi:hypothetical protein
MQEEKCTHLWEMTNVVPGLIVIKKCFHCAKISTCFTFHNKPPLEPSHEGKHFWNFMESDESFHFDVKCAKCGSVVKLDELVGLTKCIGCDETCEVGILMRKLEPENTRVYIALGRQPIEERKQLSEETFSILQDYFKQKSKSLKYKIELADHQMVRDLGKCYADTIINTDMLFADNF